MNSDTLDMIETEGLVGVVETTDTMVKATNVSLVGYEEIGSRLMIVTVRGGVDVVGAATDASAAAARQVGEVVSTYVIPRPHPDTEKTIPAMASK